MDGMDKAPSAALRLEGGGMEQARLLAALRVGGSKLTKGWTLTSRWWGKVEALLAVIGYMVGDVKKQVLWVALRVSGGGLELAPPELLVVGYGGMEDALLSATRVVGGEWIEQD